MSNESGSGKLLILFEDYNIENVSFKQIRCAIKNICDNGYCSNIEGIVKLIMIINSHYGKSLEADVQLLKLLKYLMHKVMCYYNVNEVPNEIFKFVFGSVICTTLTEVLKGIFKMSFYKVIDKINLEDVLLKTETMEMKENLSLMIMECYSMQKNEELFINNLILALFKAKNENVRLILLNMASKLKEQFPVNLKSKKQVDVLKYNIKNLFVPLIKNLQEQQNAVWEKLWMFLVQYLNKLLHNSKIVNPCLQIVESAFRSRNTEEKLKAFDCWKELINNYSLDFKYLTSDRQINLLMIPLRVTTSKQEDVIVKKNDVWIHLLKMSRSIKCIEKFLQFTFGYGCNENYELPGDVTKSLGVVSADVLLEIIGHDSEKCECTRENNILTEPIVNEENFLNVEDVIIYSILKCSIHLRYWTDLSTYNKVVQCLCMRLCVLIKHSGSVSSFQKLVQWLTLSTKVFDNLEFVNAFIDTFVYIFDYDDNKEALKEIFIFPLLKILLTFIPREVLDIVLPLLHFGYKTENPGEFLKQNIIFMTTVEMKSVKADHAFLLWIEVGKMYTDSLSSIGIRDMLKSTITQFLLWPLSYLHCCTKRDEVLCVWTDIFQTSLQMEKMNLIREFHTILMNNPLIKSNILVFLLHLSKNSCVETEDFSTEMLKVCNAILLLPNLSVQDLDEAISTFYNCINVLIKEVTVSFQSVILEEVCKGVKIILQKKQFLRGLECLENFIQKLPKSKYKIIDNAVSSDLENLCIHDDNKINTMALRILSGINLKTTEKHLEHISPRSYKMINMIETSKPGTTLSWPNSTSGLLTKSQKEDKSLKIRPKNKKYNMVIETKSSKDDDSYVLINSQVKFNEKKMNRHQRELFKKCRDDIPALYQDLSQSQVSDYNSQSLNCCLSNDTSSVKDTNYSNKNELVVSSYIKNPSNSEKDKNYKEKNITDRIQNCFNGKNKDCVFSDTYNTTPTTQKHCKTIDNKTILENLKEKSRTSLSKEEFSQVNNTSLISEISRKESENTNELDEHAFKNKNKFVNRFHNIDAKKSMKIMKELNRLKMDIVGANNFLINGPRQRRSKFRLKEKRSAENNEVQQVEKIYKNEIQYETVERNNGNTEESVRRNKVSSENIITTEKKKTNKTMCRSLHTISKNKLKSKLLRTNAATVKDNTTNDSSIILNKDNEHQYFTEKKLNTTNENESSNTVKMLNLINTRASEGIKNSRKFSEKSMLLVSDDENVMEDHQKLFEDKLVTLEKKKISSADEGISIKNLTFNNLENLIAENSNTSKKKQENCFLHNTMQNDISTEMLPALTRIDKRPGENLEIERGLESPTKNKNKQESSIMKNFDKNKIEVHKTIEIIELNNLKGLSEDIVECSQEKPYTTLKDTYNHKISSLNSFNKKINVNGNEEPVVNYLTVLTQQPKQEVMKNDEVNLRIVCKTNEIIDCEKETESCDPSASINYEFQMNLNVGDNVVNESEKEMCNLDTESILQIESNVVPDLSIISSPETVDTSARNSEMLYNTLNISPIKHDIVDMIHLLPGEHPEKHELKNIKNDDKCIQGIIQNDISFLKLPSPRSVKLIGLVSNSVQKNCFQNKISTEIICKKPSINLSSPKTDRIRKMISNCEKEKVNTSTEDTNEIQSLDYLTFTRDVPSPLAVPKIGILKRKRTDLIDEELNSPKRKKVNFSDPLTTCKMLIHIDPMEHVSDGDEILAEDFNALPEIKKNNVTVIEKNKKRQCICDESVIIDAVPKLNVNLNVESKEVELYEMNDSSKKENRINSNNSNHYVGGKKLANLNYTNLEKQILDTPGDIKTELCPITIKNHSNYSSLANCQDDGEVIIKRRLLPVFNNTLMCVLRYTDMSTVDDLYSQTSSELKIQFPKEDVVKNILEKPECEGYEVNNAKYLLSEYQNKRPEKLLGNSQTAIVSVKKKGTSSAINFINTAVNNIIETGRNTEHIFSNTILQNSDKSKKIIKKTPTEAEEDPIKEKIKTIKKLISSISVDGEFENTFRELFFTLADKMDRTFLEKLYNEYLLK